MVRGGVEVGGGGKDECEEEVSWYCKEVYDLGSGEEVYC